mmetsp:Transcript_47072/g.113110  ORF Transcript_47072/g.113110 Transcript_47072/m.113110 type:complete len:190 (-) Transcript_47072:12-581(-)
MKRAREGIWEDDAMEEGEIPREEPPAASALRAGVSAPPPGSQRFGRASDRWGGYTQSSAASSWGMAPNKHPRRESPHQQHPQTLGGGGGQPHPNTLPPRAEAHSHDPRLQQPAKEQPRGPTDMQFRGKLEKVMRTLFSNAADEGSEEAVKMAGKEMIKNPAHAEYTCWLLAQEIQREQAGGGPTSPAWW